MAAPKTPDQIYGQRESQKYTVNERERHRQRLAALKQNN